ncbi:MAG: hypothetical protein JSV05_09445 [Candidatus Bathyarchaeota archaeon]|nr:MAG: hypothetical protein JSV05_09445 [Candidatus Bathyarchaeota archaeon]
MSQPDEIPLDKIRVARIFKKILKILQREAKSSAEALAILRFGVTFFETRVGVDVISDSEIKDFVNDVRKDLLRFE